MRRILTLGALALILASPLQAAIPERGGSAVPAKAAGATSLPAMSLPLPTRGSLAAEDEVRAARGELYRFALPEAVALTPDNAGAWESLADGRRLWRLRVASPGALSLNLGFVRYNLPASARLALYPAARPTAGVVFDAGDNADHGQLWTPLLETDDLVVELVVSAVDAALVDLEIGAVNRGYRSLGGDPSQKAGLCNIDVVCPEGDEWWREIASVAVYSLYGSLKCTGALINNTERDQRPFFLTAAHCQVTETAAPTVNVFWNFESPVCGDQSGGNLNDSQAGTTLRAFWGGDETADMTLLELDDLPPPAYAAIYAGWNRTDAAPSSAVAIHHPDSDEKSISFDHDPLSVTSYGGSTAPGNGTHLRVGNWELGTTEVGSSGSPLFGPDHRIVGQLHGGFAACGVPEPDWYGRLTASWEGGGDAASRLSDWLDPGGTGALSLEFLEPDRASMAVRIESETELTGPAEGPFEPALVTWSLVSTGTLAVPWSATADASWLELTPSSGTLAPGGEVVITGHVVVDGLTPGRRKTTVRFANASGDGGDAETGVALDVMSWSPRILHVAPNPAWGPADIVFEVGRPMPVRLRIYDLRGMLVADLGTVDAVTGENTYEWTGRDEDGKALPGGVFVVEVEGNGHADRVKIVQSH